MSTETKVLVTRGMISYLFIMKLWSKRPFKLNHSGIKRDANNLAKGIQMDPKPVYWFFAKLIGDLGRRMVLNDPLRTFFPNTREEMEIAWKVWLHLVRQKDISFNPEEFVREIGALSEEFGFSEDKLKEFMNDTIQELWNEMFLRNIFKDE